MRIEFITKSYNHGWVGPEGIVAGLRSLQSGAQKVLRFVVGNHHLTEYRGTNSANGDHWFTERHVAIVYPSEERGFVFPGSNYDPNAGGAHLMSEGSDVALAAAVLTRHLSAIAAQVIPGQFSSVWLFRQPEEGQDPNENGRREHTHIQPVPEHLQHQPEEELGFGDPGVEG